MGWGMCPEERVQNDCMIAKLRWTPEDQRPRVKGRLADHLEKGCLETAEQGWVNEQE